MDETKSLYNGAITAIADHSLIEMKKDRAHLGVSLSTQEHMTRIRGIECISNKTEIGSNHRPRMTIQQCCAHNIEGFLF